MGRQLPARAVRSLLALALACAAVTAPSASTFAAPLGGQAACNLIERVPQAGHPIRKYPALRVAFQALGRAAEDPAKNGKAFDLFGKALEPVWRQAETAFARPPADPKTREAQPFRSEPARAFLERWVLTANAPLRVGLDRFEPSAELAAAMALAACWADRRDDAIALARRTSGPEAAPVRAFAALLLLEAGRVDEARELSPELGDEGFLARYVQAELATDAEEKRRLHRLAGSLAVTPDQQLAWTVQAGRMP